MIQFWKPKTVGVDIGRRNIAGISLKKAKGRVHLDRYFFIDLKKELGDQPDVAAVSQALRAQAEIHRFKNARVSTALKDSEVHGFLLELPEMPPKDLALAVQNEVSLQMRLPEEDLTTDYSIESVENGPHGKVLKVRVYCSVLKTVSEHMKMLSQAGLRPYSIESEMQASVEALRFNEYITDTSSCVVISIGDSATIMGFVVDGTLVATRLENTGLGDITDAFQQEFGISYAEAEKIKNSYSFGDDPNVTSPYQKIHEDILFRIFQSIKDAIESFQESHPGVTLAQAFLIGGGSGVAKMDSVLQSFFKIPTEIPNPFRKIEIYTQPTTQTSPSIGEVAPYMTTAVGLALRNVA